MATGNLQHMISTDVAVVGAGPAGAAAAIELARGGRDVVLFDKARFPREKCCGDGLTTEALRILEELGIRPETVSGWNTVTDIVIRNPRGREVRLPLPATGHYAAVVPRAELDHRLVREARAAGASVHEGVAFRDLETGADRVLIETSAGPIQARYLVAADGMWSPVRKRLAIGPADHRGEWFALRQYFSGVGPRAQHLVVWFEEDLLPGYAWSFPLPGQRANVGFGIKRGAGRSTGELTSLWHDLLQRPHVRAVLGPGAVPEGRHRAWPIPARVDGLPMTHGRVLFAGDAVGATDPMTGEGIAQALTCGREAARAITAAGPDRPGRAAVSYRRSLKRDLVVDHRLARSLARVLERPLGVRSALRLADLTPWTRRNFARWMFEDYPRAMILTPGRWHRQMFSRPGAFIDHAEPAPVAADPELARVR